MSARIRREDLLPWLGRLAALVMLGVLGWLGASIYWTLRAPESARPSAQMETDLQKAQQALTARHLFGVYVVAGGAVAAPSDIRLNGAIAAQKPGQRAYALLSIEGKPAQLVKEGEELAPGITLQHVAARQVELLRGGQPQTLSLPESSKAETNKNAVASANPAIQSPPTPAAVFPSPAATPRNKNRRNTDDDT